MVYHNRNSIRYTIESNISKNLATSVEAYSVYSDCKVGDRIRSWGEKKAYTVMGRNKRFVIIAKPQYIPSQKRATFKYSIIDLVARRQGPDNLIFWFYDYLDPEDCKKAIKALENNVKLESKNIIPDLDKIGNTLDISHRRGIDYIHKIDKREPLVSKKSSKCKK